MSKSVQRVIDAAAASGLQLEISEFPDGTRTAQDAADAVGCQVDQIVKSLVFAAGDDRQLILALTSGANKVNLDALAQLAGVDKCHRATPDEVRAATGYAIGGVSPLGHSEPVPTWFDPHLLTFSEIWAAAGTPRHVFPIEPSVLLTLSAAVEAEFTE